jgi:hypothetical protein
VVEAEGLKEAEATIEKAHIAGSKA